MGNDADTMAASGILRITPSAVEASPKGATRRLTPEPRVAPEQRGRERDGKGRGNGKKTKQASCIGEEQDQFATMLSRRMERYAESLEEERGSRPLIQEEFVTPDPMSLPAVGWATRAGADLIGQKERRKNQKDGKSPVGSPKETKNPIIWLDGTAKSPSPLGPI